MDDSKIVHFAQCLSILILSKMKEFTLPGSVLPFSSFSEKQKKIALWKVLSHSVPLEGLLYFCSIRKILGTLPPCASCSVVNFNRTEKQVALQKL